MNYELQIYRDFTHLYSGEEPIVTIYDLTQRLVVGDLIHSGPDNDPAVVKECIYHPKNDTMVCFAIHDKPTETIEKEVD